MSVRIRSLAAVLSTALVFMVVPRVSEALSSLLMTPGVVSADLMVTKTGPASATPGSDVSFTVQVTNLGPDGAANVSLTDEVPAGMTFVSFNQESGPSFTCSQSSGTITCSTATMPANAIAIFTFVMNISAEAPVGSLFTNTATATSATSDPNPDNNTGTAEVRTPQADLFVTKTGPESAAAGTDVSFDVTIINGGPEAATDVSLIDTLPPGTTFVSNTQNSGSTFSCVNPSVGSGGSISCSIETLPLNASANFTFVLHIPSDAAVGTTFTNIATASSKQTFDPNDENDTGAAAVTIPGAASADLFAMKSGPEKALPNSDVPFSIVITNFGPSAAANVSFSDLLPGNMTFVSMVQNGGPLFSCNDLGAGNPGTVTCTLATMNAGATATFTLTTHIPANTPGGTVYENRVTVSSLQPSTPDPNPDNNSSIAIVTASAADVSIVKTGPATATADTDISWTITLANAGPETAFAATFVDQLPSGTTFVSLVQNNGPAASSCSTPSPGQNGPVSCVVDSLSSEGGSSSAQFTLTAHIGNTLSITNTATAFSANADPNNNNNSSSVTTSVTPVANLSVTKTDSPDPVIAGANITYNVTISNSGPSSAQNVSLVDEVPANTTFLSATQISGPTFPCVIPVAGASTGSVNCTNSILAPGASAVFSIVVRVNSSVPAGSTITNTAIGATTTNDSNSENNTGSATTAVIASADLSVAKIDSPDPVLAGNNLTYTITVTNNGTSDAQNLLLSDTLPASTTLVSFSVPAGWTRTDAVPIGGTGAVTATAVTLVAGGSAQFTLVVKVNAGTANNATITNSATATTTTADPNSGNNTGTATTAVSNNADLSVTKSDAPDPVFAGNNITYTINFKNNGPLSASSVTVTDAVPANTTFVSAAVSTGTGWTGTLPPDGGTGNIIFSKGTVLNQETATFTILVNVNSNTPNATIISNTAVAASSTVDADSSNNSATATTSVGSDPDLTITKTHSGNFSGGQVGATYIITVRNIGTGLTNGSLVTVTDTVPLGLTPTGPNGVVNGWTCAINGQTLACTRSDVLSGNSSYPAINLTVTVANPAPLNVTNTATVSGGGDINPNNNTASDPTAINCSPNFALNNGSPLMISRFRENGPAGPQDEFVEIFNPGATAHTVASGNCDGGGYGVYASAGNGTTSSTATLVCYIPNGTVIPAGGYYLCTGVSYSLNNLGRNGGVAGATATGDAPIGCGGQCGANIPDDAGLALINKAEPTLSGGFASFEFGTVIYDKVGFGPYGAGAPAPAYPSLALTYCEGGVGGCLKPVGDAGTGAACTNPTGQFPVFPASPACYGLAGQYEFLRRQTLFDFSQGTVHQDTNNNGNDFLLVAPNPAENMGVGITGVTGVTAVLGSAGPYNSSAPPDMPAVKLTRTPFDGTDQLGPRNLERRYIPDPTIANPGNNPLGTITLRYKYTNNSGSPINGVRFEVDNLSTLCGPQSATPANSKVGTGDARNLGSTTDCGPGSFTAVLKALNSTAEIMVDSSGTARMVNGTVMEDLSVGTAPGAGPLSPNGGGIDSTFIINPSTDSASVGNGVTGGLGNFATTIGTTDPTRVLRVGIKFGVVRSGRFILLLVPMAKSSPAP